MNISKWKKIMVPIILFLALLTATQRSAAEEVDQSRTTVLQTIDFKVKREGDKYKLTDLAVKKSFGKISSVTILMPSGVQLNMSVPEGWTSYNNPSDSVINYLLTSNNTPEEVQEIIANAQFPIQDEQLTQGVISISLSTEEISSWVDKDDGKTHYYKFVFDMGRSWLDSYNLAKTERYKGLTGYLATITSPEEHDYIYTSIAKNPGWLGGTRLVKKNNTRILDEPFIDNIITSYDTSKDEWYWTGGPESGNVFFVGKSKSSPWSVPTGVYDGWSEPEPNNNGLEYVLQFALDNTKWWNDLPNVYNENPEYYLNGYYVEFSAYGDQKELVEDSHSAAVPQRVKVQYLEQETNKVLASEVMTIGDTFAVEDAYDTTTFRQMFDGYDLILPKNEKGQYAADPTTVVYYYSKQQLIFHIQQVVLSSKQEVVIPKKGYVEIRNVDAPKPEAVTAVYEKMNAFATSKSIDNLIYANTDFIRNPTGQYYQVEGKPIQFYQSVGYILTDQAVPHQAVNRLAGFPVIDGNAAPKEYWITLYYQLHVNEPKPYNWNYQQHSFGTLVP